ncbi:MAG: class I SAM-dependent methyltransferase [Holosporaceae bacterium]|jgi:SAM-dependent methyltransferase|nr:class I SAM-dependent methyltransferase [Holosporaceae bacterium]
MGNNISIYSTNKQKFPNPIKGEEEIVWNGKKFVGESYAEGVLVYPMSTSPTGWNDDLTGFHEEISNGQHPIDKASFDIGIENLKKYCPILSNSDGGGAIIEIGCSSGILLRYLWQSFPCTQIVGTDIISKTLHRISKELEKENIPTPLLCFDVTDCPLANDSYDAVIALNVLEHIKDHERAVEEIHRILKPGGVFVFEVPYGEGLFDAYDVQLRHYRRYSDAQILKILNKSGLKQVYFSHLGFFLYPLFWCVKKLRARYAAVERQQSICESRLSKNLISKTAGFLPRMIFKIELILGKIVSYPYGIRCVGVFQKPE